MVKTIKNIIVCVRYPINKNGKKTIKYAKFLTKLLKSELKLVHIIPKEFTIKPEIIRKNTNKKIKSLISSNDIIIYFDSLTSGLKKTVKENHVDLLIMGAHKRNLLDNILEGMVDMDITARIVKKVPCPVLIVK